MFKGESPFSDYVDATFLTIAGISLLVLIGLLIAMVYFLVRYSRKRNPHPTNIEGNLPLDIEPPKQKSKAKDKGEELPPNLAEKLIQEAKIKTDRIVLLKKAEEI